MFNEQSIYALVVGGISMIIAGFLNFIVRESKEETSEEIIEDVMKTEQSPTTYL